MASHPRHCQDEAVDVSHVKASFLLEKERLVSSWCYAVERHMTRRRGSWLKIEKSRPRSFVLVFFLLGRSLPRQCCGAIVVYYGATETTMFYLQVTPPTSRVSPATMLQPTRPRPRSAAAAVRVLNTANGSAIGNGGVHQSPRAATHVSFAPRGLVSSGARPRSGSRGGVAPAPAFVEASLQAQSSTSARVQLNEPMSPPSNNAVTSKLVEQAPMLPAPPASNIVTNPIPAAASVTTGNVYHALSARKSAEETAKQLALRIAHFRAQEERVLREVQHMKQRLEFLLSPREEAVDESTAVATPVETPRGNSSRSRRPLSAAAGSQRSPRLEPKTPRSREQLQFLNKQRRIIQIRKLESARQQKERRKMALDAQRQKEEAEQERRAALKERIRLQQQQALELRAAKQHQQLESLEHQHYDRLRTEQLLEQHARSMIDEMREEEKNLALRLQALQVHQEHIKRSLEGGQQSASVRPAAPTSSAPTEAK